MKNLIKIIAITGILLVGFVLDGAAQKRPENTSSARAYYGNPGSKPKVNYKKKKVRNYTHSRPAKGTSAADAKRGFRRRNSS